jgi:hypothetical protein
MKSGFFIVLALVCSAEAQMRDNRDKQMTCDNGDRGSDRARFCQIREQSVAGPGRLVLDGGLNGGASVKGWLRNDVLVRAKIEAHADNEAQASSLAGRVQVESSGGQVRATGPDAGENSWWSVSYEIFVPQTTDLNLKTFNGGISISDVRGRIEFDANNGGINLKRVAGDVSGTTVNGGVNVELAGNSWDGRQLEVSTRNGGVTIAIPESYSAHVQTETVNGGVASDFPVTMHGDPRPRNLDFNVGSGGPLIRVTTTNGGVKLKKI